MNQEVNELILKYDLTDKMGATLLGLMVGVGLLIVMFKAYQTDKKISLINGIIVGFFIFFTTFVLLIVVPDILEKRHWRYVIDDTHIHLYDVSKEKTYSGQNLIQSVSFSELTPYFFYKQVLSINQHQVTTKITFKTEEGQEFLTIKTNKLHWLIRDYRPLHEKNPDWLDRMIVINGKRDFEYFVDQLKER